MSAAYFKSDYLEALARELIEEHAEFYFLKSIRIGYQYSDAAKTANRKVIFADTTKISEKYKAFMPYDFIITFYAPNSGTLSKKAKRILMYHELKHIGFDGIGYYLVPHDIEDFRDILDKYGLDWQLL